jgi:hypothetical protein
MDKIKHTNGKHEAIRYLKNARELLYKSPIEDNRFTDIKYVREACGTAYLAILEAIDNYLVEKKGFSQKELPKSVEEYRAILHKHFASQNGKLLGQFSSLYKELHIAGYYQGLLEHVNAVKLIFQSAETFIKRFQN